MYLGNLMYHWTSPETLEGVILHTCALSSEQAESRSLPVTDSDFVLIDPCMYLWGLDASCVKTVSKIDSYSWVPEEKSDTTIICDEDVAQLIDEAIDWQISRGVSLVLIPTPMVTEEEKSVDEFLRWLDIGINQISGYDCECVVTFCIRDIVVNDHFDSILDQITARIEIDGIYYLVDTTYSDGQVVDVAVLDSYLKASYYIGSKLNKRAYINYAGIFGLACLAVGATAFAYSYEAKGRSLNTDNFIDRGGGGAYPWFLSLKTAAYYRPTRDLKRVRDEELLDFFRGDITDASSMLWEALENDDDPSSVVEWSESVNNVKAAKMHQIQLMKKAAVDIGSILDQDERIKWVKQWLRDADMTAMYLNEQFRDEPLGDDTRHLAAWKTAFNAFVKKHF